MDLGEVTGTLITIGDELLSGEVADSNATVVARELRARGFRLTRMVTIGDAEEGILEALRDALPVSRFLICTGGLGPTSDDRTPAAAARAFRRPLVIHEGYEALLRGYLARRGMTWSDAVAKMALLPQGAEKLGEEVLAAGFSLQVEGTPCFFLPGVPSEMRAFLASDVIPELERHFPQRPFYFKRILRVQELPESRIQQLLVDLERAATGVEFGYLPQGTENWVTLLTAAAHEEEARARVDAVAAKVTARLGRVSGRDGETLEETVGELLRRRTWKVAVAESCTGGRLAARLAAVAGASDYLERAFVTYSNRAKQELLGVPEALLEVHGAVSEEVAAAMAQGARARAPVDVTLAVTGIAGPTGATPGKPVGTVFVACATRDELAVERHQLFGDRLAIQEKSVHAALVLLWKRLLP